MSSTRRTEDPATFRQGRYASDPDFVEIRGIEATAALLKAKTVSLRERALIFFLQSRSLDEGGMEALVDDLISLVPEHFGTETMRWHPALDGAEYTGDFAAQIRHELSRSGSLKEYAGSDGSPRWNEVEEAPAVAEISECIVIPGDGEFWRRRRHSEPALRQADCRAACLSNARQELPRMITEICVRPRLQVLPSGWRGANQLRPGDEVCSVPYLRHLGWTLDVYRSRYVERAARRFARTSIADVLQPELDYALETRRMVLIEGNSGVGKSESAKAWCDRNRHVARYLTLSGISNRTTLCRSVAHALGLPKSLSLSATKILPRIEDFLRQSRLMLVIDEAHYLWPQTNRPDRCPELINWLMTACSNEKVPVALITTSEWHRLQGNTEKHTRWNAEQLGRRIVRFSQLPERPSRADFLAVIRSIATDAAPTVQEALAGYGYGRDGSLTRMVDTLEDARRVAAAAGRQNVTAKDVKTAVDARKDSDNALMRPQSAGERFRNAEPLPSSPAIPAEESSRQSKGSAPGLQESRATAADLPDQTHQISLPSDRRGGSGRTAIQTVVPILEAVAEI